MGNESIFEENRAQLTPHALGAVEVKNKVCFMIFAHFIENKDE